MRIPSGSRRVGLTTVLAAGILVTMTHAQQTDTRTADWTAAAELSKTYFEKLNTAYAFKGHESEYLKTWDAWQKDLTAFLPVFQAKYGKTPEEVSAKFEGVDVPQGVANSIRQICGDLFTIDLAAKQKEIAGWAIEDGDEAFNRWQALTQPDKTKLELKVDYAERALRHYERAAAIDVKGDYTAHVDKAKQAVDESRKVWMAALKELKWPGDNKDFEGPGDPDDLNKAAMKLLQSVESWSKPEYNDKHIPIACCVTGKGWAVSKENPLTRKPTQYSLDFLVAFAGTKDPDLAYVYHMVFYTKEEEGVDKAPPFRYLNSRQYAKYRMLMSDVPKMVDVKKAVRQAQAEGGAASGTDQDEETAGGTASGFWGLIFRLLLTATTAAAGLVCAGELVTKRIPASASLVAKLAAKRSEVGIAAVVVGALAFLRVTLFHFNPIADILPQALGVAAGLILAGPTLLGPKAEKLKPLTERTGLIGLAAIVAGIIHLLIAGVWLF